MKKIYDFLASVKLTVIFFVVIIGTSIGATFMEQEIANKFVYNSLWFRLLFASLIINTIACLTKKRINKDSIGSFIMHLSLPVIMLGVLIGNSTGIKGMMIIKQGQSIGTISSNRGGATKLPFELKLTKFTVEMNTTNVNNQLYITDAKGSSKGSKHSFNGANEIIEADPFKYKIEIKKVLPDFVMGEDGKPASRSLEWKNPAVLINVDGEEVWLFSRYPDFHGSRDWNGSNIRYVCRVTGGGVKNYVSDVIIMENNKEVLSKKIEVNNPLVYKEYTIYQNSYDDKKYEWSGLFVKKDSGVLVVYLGFILLCLGMSVQVYKKLVSINLEG